jgi:hypothetical protein
VVPSRNENVDSRRHPRIVEHVFHNSTTRIESKAEVIVIESGRYDATMVEGPIPAVNDRSTGRMGSTARSSSH